MNKNIHLYLQGDNLFVYSRKSYALYGFRGFYAALFLFIENNANKFHIYEFIKNSGSVLDEKMYHLVEQILSLLYGNVEEAPLENESNFKGTSEVVQRNGFLCSLDNWEFFLGVNDKDVLDVVNNYFNHLIVYEQNTNKELPFIDIGFNNGKYILSFNNEKIREAKSVKHLLPVLQDVMRMVYYHNADYLISLHAASLQYKGQTFIFPGVSGAGKSTLAFFLSHCGFSLFSDELTVINKSKELLPLPFRISLKEGSWRSVESFVENFSLLQTHLRFDEQKIRALRAPLMQKEKLSVMNSYIIFPKFEKDIEASFMRIDIIEALELINGAQYHIEDSQDVKQVESWLDILRSCKIFKINYSSLEDAKKMVEEIIEL